MFLAYLRQEKRNLFAGESEQMISRYKNQGDLICPQSKAPVTYVRHSKNGRRPHFRIHPSATDDQRNAYEKIHSFRSHKSERHELCQSYLIERLTKIHKQDYIKGSVFFADEYIIGDRRADVVMIKGNRQNRSITVYEIQFSPITLAEVQKRTEDYLANKDIVSVHWFFEAKKVFNNSFKEYLWLKGCEVGLITVTVTETIKRL